MPPAAEPDADGLHVLLPPVARWFRATFGAPTPPQRAGWPAIAAGEHTLIFAPTGSGKTLAAFLACLDRLWRAPRPAPGVRVLYVSPLKALSWDISQNLQLPLEGITAASGTPLRPLRVAVRTGDTPPAERQQLVRRPPEILITTPESLHLMLTSRARETLRTVSHVIVDEIHALCPNKRGVFLALLLERLEALTPSGFVRVGLSATQRPLEEVARYLGGRRKVPGGYEPRPVTIVDAGRRKGMDLEVRLPAVHPAAGMVWPAIEQDLLELIEAHRSTIVFANNRRVVERLTAHLNERAADGSDRPDDAPREIARAHHGSLSPERRRATEEALKAGELPAVVATASLELGIDMGAVDLVCQVESPGGIARALQRVGRAGHLVGRESKGRILAKTAGDLLEAAALARTMLQGEVEALRVPANCLDVLAQQVVACAAMDRPDVPALFDLVRQAYPYRDLTAAAFEAVLELVSGRFQAGGAAFRDLRPRVSWDRVHNRLHPLPGTAQLALVGGGTIPDTGQYPLYLGDGGPRLGELDEEFVLERRVGETFVLGTSTWRIEAIEPHRVLVGRAEGRSALMPFWRGEDAPRTAELGEAVGALVRELAGRLDNPGCVDWLRSECRLDARSARALRDYVARQIRRAGAAPDDRTVLVETFVDPAGELGLAVLTPFGGKLHQALKLALQARLRQRLGIAVACLHADDGVLIRLPRCDEPPSDLFDGLTPERAEALIREELGDSALFGLRFRQNAGRALLMPRPDPGKRTPLWLQRLRARDLLQIARGFPDFPIVVETYRECLDDDLDLPRLRAFLSGIRDGSIRVVTHHGEEPSPFASELIFRFTLTHLYEWDEPRRADRPRAAEVDGGLLDPLLAPGGFARLIDPAAVGRVENRLRGVGHPPRTADEMAEALRRLGDLTPSELSGPMLGFLHELEGQGRAGTIDLPDTVEPARWIGAEDFSLYERAFGIKAERRERAADPHPNPLPEGEGAGQSDSLAPWVRAGVRSPDPGPSIPDPGDEALATIVRRYLEGHALVGLEDLTARYPIDAPTAADLLERWSEEGRLVRLEEADGLAPRWAERRNLEEVRRLSIALQRREAVAVRPEVFADFVARRQHVHPEMRREGAAAVPGVLEVLAGFAAPADVWEAEILPRRIRGYRPTWLDEALSGGGWTWRAEGSGEPRVAIVPRDFAGAWPARDDEAETTDEELRVLDDLSRRGARFAAEIAQGLGMEPSRVRAALHGLIGRGRATNDRFDPLRPAGRAMDEALARASAAVSAGGRRGQPRPGAFRRALAGQAEGRWAFVPAGDPDDDPEAAVLAWAAVLLARYGVLTRETAALDPWAPAWRDLAPALARAELQGELRRGYFVEGLSGIQYAPADAADELARLGGSEAADPAPMLLSTLDPANLYGSGAPLDVPLLEGGTARLTRSAANYLVLIGGRPVLIVEGHGRRLTGLASASEAELRAAVALVPSLAGPSRRVLKVETYNTAPALAGPAAPWLAEAGFVREFPGMAYYAGW